MLVLCHTFRVCQEVFYQFKYLIVRQFRISDAHDGFSYRVWLLITFFLQRFQVGLNFEILRTLLNVLINLISEHFLATVILTFSGYFIAVMSKMVYHILISHWFIYKFAPVWWATFKEKTNQYVFKLQRNITEIHNQVASGTFMICYICQAASAI